MKNSLFSCLLVSMCFGSLSAQTWTQETSPIASIVYNNGVSVNSLYSVSFLDTLHGITGGGAQNNQDPVVLAYTNGVTPWTNSTSSGGYIIMGVQYISNYMIYAVAQSPSGAAFYRSDNAGQSFADTSLPVLGTIPNTYSFTPYQMVFLDSINGYICGNYYGGGACNCSFGQVIKTTDGGRSWNSYMHQNNGLSSDNIQVNSISFLNVNAGFALSANDSLYKTIDGGLTWDNYYLFNNGQSPSYIYFQSADTGWATGVGQLLKTTDGGMTWLEVPTYGYGTYNFTKIIFTDNSNAWLVAGNAIFHCARMSGNIDSIFYPQPCVFAFNNSINDICMLNNSLGYAVGDSGYIYKFSCPASNTNITTSICSGDSFFVGNESFNSTGHYTTTLTASNCGCDSNINLNLTVNPLPNSTVNYNDGVLSTGTFAHYQWLYGTTPIPGDTFQSITPSLNGYYTVLVTNANGCFDTAGFNVVNASIETVYGDVPNISLYPNPAIQSCTVYIQGGSNETYSAQIIDMTGKAIGNLFSNKVFDSGSFTFPVSDYTKGVYLLKVTNSSGQNIVKKLVVE